MIRSDGAWNPQGPAAGLGWVVHSGSAVREFKGLSTHVASALVAEGLALLEAVKTGARENLKTVCFEADSLQLINAINSGTIIPELYGVLENILSFVSIFKFVAFVWIPREKWLCRFVSKNCIKSRRKLGG